MGGTSKLRFPLPHRRQKHQQTQQQVHDVQMISAPMTSKAQKFLGTAEINIDATSSPTSPLDTTRPWETRSTISGVSGISVTVTESSAPGHGYGSERSTVKAGGGGAAKNDARAGWDEESAIIPKDLGLGSSLAGRGRNLDTTTDASSLRRRRSSSTIVSYYDKTKLPLSISQQTSNSAMAKGPPSKILDTLSMEVPRPAPAPPVQAKKKPTKLDLAQLLPHGATSRMAKYAQKSGLVLGPDMLTRSPSVVSSSPAASPFSYEHKPDKKLRKKLTKESLKSPQTSRTDSFPSFSPDPAADRLRIRASEAGTLHQLYEHYEQTSWRDTLPPDEPVAADSKRPSGTDADLESRGISRQGSRQSITALSSTSSPVVSKPRHHLSPSVSAQGWTPFSSYSPDADFGTILENPRVSVTSSTLASPAGEYATSVSSRHTRTSKASKRTESFADFDPNATSVLSLSSDSEDDYPDPPKTATSVPSVGSRDSMFSATDYRRPSNSSISQDSVRTQPKSRYRNSLTPQNPFVAIPEHAQSTTSAQSGATSQSSSLVPSYATNDSPRPSVSTASSSARSGCRLSQGSASTTDSAPTHFSRPRPLQTTDIRHVAMLQTQDTASAQRLFAPADKAHSTQNRESQPRSPLSPASMEFVIRDRPDPNNEHDGPILTLSGADSASEERFMAVTKQEEMLLAAMRAKRALMRESLQQVASQGPTHRAAGKKESVSSIRTVTADTLQPPPLKIGTGNGRSNGAKVPKELRFLQAPTQKSMVVVSKNKNVDSPEGQEQVLLYLDRTMSTMNPYDMAEPSPDLSDFVIDFDAEQFPAPPHAAAQGRNHSRTSSTASAAGRLTHAQSTQYDGHESRDHPRPDSEFMPAHKLSFSGDSIPPFPHGECADLNAITQHLSPGPGGLSEDRRMRDLIEDAFRPLSPSDTIREGEDISIDQAMSPPSRKKAVRISAVGLQLPEIGQWGDDG
ncbi:hypothetical protein BD289DRAFT_483718 [Coniella lustricola]|uniref:Uncharacterized protein n=1 Tax=Coniella lustricola TaxID=2025994 RepID=A0A2T3A4F6_9PEZI|nr:hypothetical protein BD289DRAFT_483718 [Coniella lustricola]